MSRRQRQPVLENLATAREKLIGELSEGIPSLWKHQKRTVEFSRDLPLFIDMSDPGTGKTRGQIDVFRQRLEAGETDHLLIVAPKSLMISAWANDFSKFAPGILTQPAFAENREVAFDTDVPVHIINTDGVKWLEKKTKTWFKKRFGTNPMLVIDESTYFKHRTSQRSKAMRNVAKHFHFKNALSGTYLVSAIDAWHQTFILDRGERLGKVFSAYRRQVQYQVERGGFAKWVDRDDIEPVVAHLLKDITIRHLFEEVMDVPENRTHTLTVPVHPKVMAAIQTLKDEAVLMLKEGTVTAVNAAVMAGKLFQLASGCVYDQNGEAILIDNSRAELVGDLVDARDHSVVFFEWGHQKNAFSKELSKRKMNHAIIDGSVSNSERARIVDRFQEGDYRALLLHPKTGAHGLTLTRGRTTIWGSLPYQPDVMKQGLARVYRGGQKHKTENIQIVGEGTRELEVFEIMSGRKKRMETFLEILAS